MPSILCLQCGRTLDAVSDLENTLPLGCPHCGSNQVAVEPVEEGHAENTLKPQNDALAETIGIKESLDDAFPIPTEFGHYEILSRIAKGGMGVVYRARDTRLKRVVALKMILGGSLPNEEDVRRFKSEAEAAARLDHPNIVPIYEVDQIQGRHYFAMRYVDGRSLAFEIAQGPLPPRRAAELTREISSAVQHAHEHGIIHRDLKPSNVLADTQGVIQVTDFGLAKRVEHDESLTASGQVLGTPSFMPPEQALGNANAATPMSDVYSIGAILYNLITGRPPFQAATSVETILEVVNQEPVAPRRLNSHIPRDLETICLTCLQKDPQSRYATAQDLSVDIAAFLSGDPIQARPDSFLKKSLRWVKRNKVISSLGATVCLLVLSVAVAASIGYTHMRSLYEQTAWALSDAEIQSEKAEAAANLASQKARIAEQERESARLAHMKYRDEAEEREKAQSRELNALKQARDAQERFRNEQRKTAEASSKAIRAEAEREEALTLSTKTRYQHLLGQAEQRLRDGDQVAAMELLNSCPEYLRSWEWQFLLGYCASGSGNIRFGGSTHWDIFRQGSQINGIAASLQGTLIGTASEDGRIRVVDPIQGKVVYERRACENPLRVIRFSPNSRFVAAAGDDERIFVIDLKEKQQLAPLRGCPSGNTSLAFSPQGLAAGASDGTIRLWQSLEKSPIEFSTRHKGSVKSIDFLYLPPTRHVRNGAVVIVSLGSGGRIHFSHLTGKPAEVEWPRSVLNQGFKLAKLGFGSDGGLYVGGAASAELTHLAVSLPPRFIKRTVWKTEKVTNKDKNGKSVTSSVKVPKVVDVYVKSVIQLVNGKLLRLGLSRIEKTSDMSHFSVDPTNGLLAIAGDSKIRIVDPRGGKLLNVFQGHRAPITGLTWSRDGQYVVSADKKGVVHYRHRNANLDGHAGDILHITYSRANDTFASAATDNLVKVWEKANGRLLGDLKHAASVRAICFANDGQALFTGTDEGSIINWSTSQQPMIKVAEHSVHNGSVRCLAAGANSSIISGGQDGRVVQLLDGRVVKETRLESEIHCLAASGSLVAIGTKEGVFLWKPAKGTVSRLGGLSIKDVSSLSLSADAKRVAVVSKSEIVSVWRVLDSQKLVETRMKSVSDIKFNLDGKRLFVASTAGLLSIIDTDDGLPLLSLPSTGGIHLLAISRHGNMLTMAGNGGEIRTWKATTFDSKTAEVVQNTNTIVGDDFILVFDLPLEKFDETSRQLATNGFHPSRLRPYTAKDGIRAAAIWNAGGKDWHGEYGVSPTKLAEHDSRMKANEFNLQDIASYETKDKSGRALVQHAAVWVKRGQNTTTNQLLLRVDRGQMIRQQKYLSSRQMAPQIVDVFVSKSRKLNFNGIFAKSALQWQVTPLNWPESPAQTTIKLQPIDIRTVVRGGTPMTYQLALELPELESKLILSTSVDEHSRRSRELVKLGYHPVSISIKNGLDKQYVGSVWHRKLAKP